jgi:hypothetical protein
MTDKGKQLIHFGTLHFSWDRRIRQAGSTGFDPQGNRTVVYTQMAPYPAQVHAIYIQLQGSLSNIIRVSVHFGIRRVLAATVHTAIAL